MKVKFLIMAISLLQVFSLTSCSATPSKKVVPKNKPRVVTLRPDSVAYSFLGKTMSDALFTPDKVNCYSLIPKETTTPDDVVIEPHFVRDTLIAKLDAKAIGVIQFLLLSNKENYKEDSLKVKSPYYPVLEFEFIKKKVIVHVLVSMSDYSWTVVYDDKKQFNWNFSDKDAVIRFCELFTKKQK